MPVIWKFPLVLTDNLAIEMPAGAQVLTVQSQHDYPCVWALVDPENPPVRRRFVIKGTGHPFTPEQKGLAYIGTFQMKDGHLIFHVFEKLPTLAEEGE